MCLLCLRAAAPAVCFADCTEQASSASEALASVARQHPLNFCTFMESGFRVSAMPQFVTLFATACVVVRGLGLAAEGSAYKNATTSALLHRETAVTPFQYPFALNLNDCSEKPEWTRALLKAIGELNDVAVVLNLRTNRRLIGRPTQNTKTRTATNPTPTVPSTGNRHENGSTASVPRTPRVKSSLCVHFIQPCGTTAYTQSTSSNKTWFHKIERLQRDLPLCRESADGYPSQRFRMC